MSNNSHQEQSRVLRGPSMVEVYVPPRPFPRPEDLLKDFPPGDPPQVCYFGVSANYWCVLREGSMPYLAGTKVFNDEVMQWLRSIENEVERLIAER